MVSKIIAILTFPSKNISGWGQHFADLDWRIVVAYISTKMRISHT